MPSNGSLALDNLLNREEMPPWMLGVRWLRLYRILSLVLSSGLIVAGFWVLAMAWSAYDPSSVPVWVEVASGGMHRPLLALGGLAGMILALLYEADWFLMRYGILRALSHPDKRRYRYQSWPANAVSRTQKLELWAGFSGYEQKLDTLERGRLRLFRSVWFACSHACIGSGLGMFVLQSRVLEDVLGSIVEHPPDFSGVEGLLMSSIAIGTTSFGIALEAAWYLTRHRIRRVLSDYNRMLRHQGDWPRLHKPGHDAPSVGSSALGGA